MTQPDPGAALAAALAQIAAERRRWAKIHAVTWAFAMAAAAYVGVRHGNWWLPAGVALAGLALALNHRQHRAAAERTEAFAQAMRVRRQPP